MKDMKQIHVILVRLEKKRPRWTVKVIQSSDNVLSSPTSNSVLSSPTFPITTLLPGDFNRSQAVHLAKELTITYWNAGYKVVSYIPKRDKYSHKNRINK